jgi:hypothetical protein
LADWASLPTELIHMIMHKYKQDLKKRMLSRQKYYTILRQPAVATGDCLRFVTASVSQP